MGSCDSSTSKHRLVLIPAAFLWLVLAGGCERSQSAPPPPPAPEVAAVTVNTQRVLLTTELPGRTAAYRVAEIRPQVNGLIQRRLFTEGSDVKAGQLLYQIDPAPFQAALDNAMAALAKAEANLPAIRSRAERFRALLAQKAVSQQDYDDAAAGLKQVEAEVQYWKATVQSARINLGYTKVTAPISGRVGKSNVTEGAIVTAYQPTPLATIQQLDPIYVDVAQSTAELLRLRRRLEGGEIRREGKEQNKAALILEDGTQYPQEGTFQFRDVTVEPTTGSVTLRMVFPNPEHTLLPGMFVRAVVKEGVQQQAILIPQQGVSRDPKGNPVALIVGPDGIVQQRILALDRAIGDKWLVASGLTPGERVIVEGIQKIRPGTPVKVVEWESPGKEPSKPQGVEQPPSKSN
jgi:membrane fusion protein (multidrug efflux system)